MSYNEQQAAALREIERLRSELQTCRNKLKASGRAKLRAERDALKADAERYRWLRSEDSEFPAAELSDGSGYRFFCGDELDAAIDAARKP